MNPLGRIIDANANRAREALRVMEDVARFSLNHAALSGSLKSIRHDIQATLESLSLDRTALVASRDSDTDVGTTIKTETEFARAGLHDTAAAAASRLTEALRSLEEAAKA